MEQLSTEATAIVAALGVFLAALALIWGLRKIMGGSIDGAIFIAVLLVPVIVYALVSGRLAEFSGPGGWGAKFRTAATDQVETSAILENVEGLQDVEKTGLRELSRIVADLDPTLPNALLLRVGRTDYYQPGAIKTYLTTLMTVGPSTYVVFVDDETRRFVASANASQILALVASDRDSGQFMSELESSRSANAFQGYDFLIRQSLKSNETNADALQKFLDTNADALVVVSDDGKKPIGVVDRNRLITKLMVKLAGGPS